MCFSQLRDKFVDDASLLWTITYQAHHRDAGEGSQSHRLHQRRELRVFTTKYGKILEMEVSNPCGDHIYCMYIIISYPSTETNKQISYMEVS